MTLRTIIRALYLSIFLAAAFSFLSGAIAGTKCQSRTGSSSVQGCSQDP
jgi:hypothetical protein